MLQSDFRAMGSRVRVLLDTDEPSGQMPAVATWFEAWEQALSRFRIDSELSRLNSRAGIPTTVSSELWAVYLAAVDAYQLTGGLVDALVLQDVMTAGYDQSLSPEDLEVLQSIPIPMLDGAAPAAPVAPQLQIQALATDSQRRELCVPHGMGLDFGGVAKGWAADESVRRLRAQSPALVSAGGDIAVAGPLPSGEPWSIDVEDPFHPGAFVETLFLDSGGIATSGRDHRRWMRNGVPMHHVIDPRTHLPANTDVVAATVVAGTATRAEALAKAALILGSTAGLEWLEGIDDAAALLVLQSGQMLYSTRLSAYL